jgi:internalin A
MVGQRVQRRSPDQMFSAASEKIDCDRLPTSISGSAADPSGAGLTYLRSLKLVWTGISDITPLLDVPWLEELDLSGTPVWDLSPLSHLNSLRILLLNITSVLDLTPISSLANFSRLK